VGVLIIVLIAAAAYCGSSAKARDTRDDGSATWDCREYDAPFRVVTIRDEADVYSGVDEPNPSSVKGHITDGAGGVEASCSQCGLGTYYRLRGVDWWGWVRASETQ
jgi:hypothetical protein